MYHRQERPLSDAERQQLQQEHSGLLDTLGGQVGMVLIILAIDLLFLSAVVLALTGVVPGNVCGTVCWVLALLMINPGLLTGAMGLRDGLRDRREVRAALRDGWVVVERVAAHDLATLSTGSQRWDLLAVGDYAVLVCIPWHVPAYSPARPADPKGGLHAAACFETVTTRRHGRVLHQERIGQGSLPIPDAASLTALVPDAQHRAALAALLQPGLVLRGDLGDLRALLEQALADPPQVPPDLTEPWGLLQGRLEERFGLNLGLGALAWRRPRTAGDLADLVVQHLPEGSSRRVTPVAGSFYRLRAALIEQGVLRRAIRPGARLEGLIGRRRRHDTWRAVERRLGQSLPVLTAPQLPGCTIISWIVSLVFLCAFGLPLLSLLDSWAALHDFSGSRWYIAARLALIGPILLLLVVLVAVVVVAVVRQRLLCEFNGRHATVGAAARCLAEATQAGQDVPWNDEEVWRAVQHLVAGVRGCRTMEVRWQTPLVGPDNSQK
jgi:hypothetical protein